MSSEFTRPGETFYKYGDRTSSPISLYPGFIRHAPGAGGASLQYVELKGVRVVAAEPFCPLDERADFLDAFAAAKPQGKVLAMPVSQALATQLSSRGWKVWQAGSEPIYDLERIFGGGSDPLAKHCIARALRDRGAVFQAFAYPEIPQDLLAEIEILTKNWLLRKKLPELGFLSQVKPFALSGLKRYFTLSIRESLLGCVAAAPLYRDNQIIAWYFKDILCLPGARAGTRELLVYEAMRALHSDGAREARFGMSALANLEPGQPGHKFLHWGYEHWRAGYDFKALAESKRKFEPDHWNPLFMAAKNLELGQALRASVAVHFPQGLTPALIHLSSHTITKDLALRPEVKAKLGVDSALELMPKSFKEYLYRTKFTTALVLFFILVHVSRLYFPYMENLKHISGYVPGDVTWRGLFLGPLFHNHNFHLFGDQLSFYLAGSLLEIILGPVAMLALTAAGLWLSNPITHLTCYALLKPFSAETWSRFLQEADHGSSNSLFVLIGAYGALLKRCKWLIVPFLAYAIFMCVYKNSWLALHHILTLGLGFLAVWWWRRR